MASMVVVTGVKAVIGKMKAYDIKAQNQLKVRLLIAAKLLKRESMKIVPRDKGHLIGSAYHRLIPAGWLSDAIVGYTAEYAVYVHEDLDKAHGAAYNKKYAKEIANQKDKYHKAKRPDEQAKFLERPVRNNRSRILRILAFDI